MIRRCLALLSLSLLLAGLSACGSAPVPEEPTVPPDPPEPFAPRPWTTAFQLPAVLVAEEVRIEGPEDLLEHVVLRQDPDRVSYETRTIDAGLLQTMTVTGEGPEAMVRVNLDAWEIVALRRLIVLQRPGEVPVSVQATGEAWWSDADGSQELRRPTLEFRGERGR